MKRFYRSIDPTGFLSPEGIDDIWNDALYVLEVCGVEFHDTIARKTLACSGAQVDGIRVRFDPEMITEALAQAPSNTMLCARNPVNDTCLGGMETVSTPLYGATHILDPDGSKRLGTLADLKVFHRAAQAANILQNVGSNIVEPTDIAPAIRHLATMESVLTNCDKSFMPVTSSRDPAVSILGLAGVRAQDSVDMAKIALGSDYHRGSSMVGVATCVAALNWAGPALQAIRIFAEEGQVIMLAPFAVVGKNAAPDPSTLLTQITAEILAGAVYAQAVRPGTSIMFGPHFAMALGNTGIPQVCTDLMLAASGQLARKAGLPFRASGGLTNSSTFDVKAANEAFGTITTSLTAGAHFLFHAAGWLENGLTISVEKFNYDCNLLADEELRSGGLKLAQKGEARNILSQSGPNIDHSKLPHTKEVISKNYRHSLNDYEKEKDFLPLSEDTIAELGAFVAHRAEALSEH